MNLQTLTPDVLRIIARRGAVPLGVLLVVGGGILYVTDELVQDNVELGYMIAATEQEIQETTDRIATIDQELGVIREKGRRYDQILVTGFTRPQNRLAANQIVEQLGRKHDLSSLTYIFEPEVKSQVTGQNGVEFELSATKISLELQAQMDSDLSGFIADFAHQLQGQVQIRSLILSRAEEIDSNMLQRVASGSSTGAFNATIELTWHNILADDPASGDGEQDVQP